MSRSRNIKPGFFTNELLAELPFAARLLFIGLWTLADREGRLEDRPVQIKMRLFAADAVGSNEIEAFLTALHQRGFIYRYLTDKGAFIQVIEWKKHQNPHFREKISVIPSPESLGLDPRSMAQKPQAFSSYIEEKPQASDMCIAPNEASMRQKASGLPPIESGVSPADSLIPDSLIPKSFKNSPSFSTDEPPIAANAKKARKPKAVQVHPRFEEFWKLYPRKVDKGDASKTFARLDDNQAQAAIAAIPKHATHWQALGTDPKYIPHASRWLNAQRWTDVLDAVRVSPVKLSRQAQVFEVLANDHRYAQTADRLAGTERPPGFHAAGAALARLQSSAGNDPDDPACLDADFSDQGDHRS